MINANAVYDLIFQSTLPRGERQRLYVGRTADQKISIHAPTRGATWRSSMARWCCQDFNPRSHEGSDPCQKRRKPEETHFNPRSHEGSDKTLVIDTIDWAISIHAPTRGATKMMDKILSHYRFQSTLPRGERPQRNWKTAFPILFQSTLPRGERQQIYTNILTYSCKIFLFFSFSIYSLSLSIKFHLSFSHFSSAKLSMFLCILGFRTYSYRISVSSAAIP